MNAWETNIKYKANNKIMLEKKLKQLIDYDKYIQDTCMVCVFIKGQ